jgi:ABC-type glycerol-3-phosphate transport system permease component
LDVNIINIELVDQGLYNIVTSKGSVTITPSNIIRIERTYTKTAITGVPVELDKIFTDKGFIYFSSLDSYAETGRAIANSVDNYTLKTWSRPNTTLHTVQPYAYAIGTPKSNVTVIFLLVFAQYLSLTIGGITLFILISPIGWRNNYYQTINTTVAQESDFRTTEEQLGAVAK